LRDEHNLNTGVLTLFLAIPSKTLGAMAHQFSNVGINIPANVGLSIGAIFGSRVLAEAWVKG
jgi:hypothetical protein